MVEVPRRRPRDDRRPTPRLVPTEAADVPYWGVVDVLLWAFGMAALVGALYFLVFHGFLRARAAGLITDVPGQFGILYAVLRFRYQREPWIALGWVRPVRSLHWLAAAGAGLALGGLVMAVENSGRFRIHFHDFGYAVVFGGVLAALIEETIFRGMILPVVLRYAQPFAAAAITGVIFALYHGLYKGLPPADIVVWITVTGTAYGLMRIRSHSTLTSAVMHCAYNLTLFIWQGA